MRSPPTFYSRVDIQAVRRESASAVFQRKLAVLKLTYNALIRPYAEFRIMQRILSGVPFGKATDSYVRQIVSVRMKNYWSVRRHVEHAHAGLS
jgi:hypothetical protein